MATRQLLSLRDFIPDSLGNPAREHYVHILEPGTVVAVTSFKDGALQSANTSPVALSASGKASIWVSRDVDVLITRGPLVTDPVLVDEPNANPDVAGGTSSGLVPNGSFENDSDADDVPDGWTEVADVGSANGIDTTVSSDGLQSFRFTSVGTGGGSLTTTDFFVVNDIEDLRVNFDLFSSVVDVLNIVTVQWYDITQVPISNSVVYTNAVSNPLVFTPQATLATPPAGARFAKLELIGCDSSDPTPGSTFYDRVNVFYPLVVTGAFDNITIQNNEIISTNTDGRIQLRPDGNGGVDVTSDGTVDLAGIENPFNVGNVDDPASNPHIAMDATQIQAKSDGTNAAPLGINLLGGLVTLGSLQVNGVLAELLNTAATATTMRVRNSVGGITLALDSVADGAIAQTDAAGAVEDGWLTFARNGGVTLLNNNIARLASTADGADVFGTLFDLDNSGAATQTQFIARNSVGGLGMRVLPGGGALILQLSSAGVSEDTWLALTRNGAVGINHNDVAVARSALVASGGFEVNNTVTGAGFERVLTTADLTSELGAVRSTTLSRANTAVLADDPVLSGFALQPDTAYVFDIVLICNGNGATNNDFQWAIDFNGELANVETFGGSAFWYEENLTDAPIDTTDAGIGGLSGSVDFTGSADYFVVIHVGVVTQSDYVADTAVDLQWAQLVSQATATRLVEGSSFRITDLGSNFG